MKQTDEERLEALQKARERLQMLRKDLEKAIPTSWYHRRISDEIRTTRELIRTLKAG